MPTPAFSLVLHSHIPYCRRAGRWPHGEEWLHEAIAETYVPLLTALHDLLEEGVRFRLVVGLTPVLVEQLADPGIATRFEAYVDDRRIAAAGDVKRFAPGALEADPVRATLAAWYADWYGQVQTAFRTRFEGDLVGAFRSLQNAGVVDIMTSAATHAYLPLLDTDESIRAQVATGVRAYKRHFGRDPTTFWLPECAYRPAYYQDVPGGRVRRPGLEAFLEGAGLTVFFVETHAIAGGAPVGKAAGDVIGPYGGIPERDLVPPAVTEPQEPLATYSPVRVAESHVVAIGRDNATSMQVWSAHGGYPGDERYREFHRKDRVSGLQYWRVTGSGIDLGAKELYDVNAARARAAEHAAHFAGVVEDTATGFATSAGTGLVAAMYDTELFGHWWFEGPTWLKQVLGRLAGSSSVELTTPAAWLGDHPPERAATLPEGSWGAGGTHHTWSNDANNWMWPLIRACEVRMRDLAERFPDTSGARQEALNQAARELLLLQSSDWPFLVSTGQAREYAAVRFTEHAAKFHRIAFIAEGDVTPADEELVETAFDEDNVFTDVDYRDWARATGAISAAASRP